MSSRGTWLEGSHVFLDDAHGWPTHIPADRVAGLLAEAKASDSERTRWAFRPFARDVLQGAYDLLPTCDQCRERPAFEDMGDGNTFCETCCSSAAGSKYDDRIEDYS